MITIVILIKLVLFYMIGIINPNSPVGGQNRIFLNFQKRKSGFTLIEMLVALSIFSFIMLAITGVFQVILRMQNNSLAANNLQESLRYAFENMSKEIRDAKKGAILTNVYNDNSGVLKFENKNGTIISYELNNERLIARYKNGASIEKEGYLTPKNIKVNSFVFFTNNQNSEQPLITLTVEAETKNVKEKQKMRIQTSISTRYYEE